MVPPLPGEAACRQCHSKYRVGLRMLPVLARHCAVTVIAVLRAMASLAVQPGLVEADRTSPSDRYAGMHHAVSRALSMK